jgi:hypothetical protein
LGAAAVTLFAACSSPRNTEPEPAQPVDASANGGQGATSAVDAAPPPAPPGDTAVDATKGDGGDILAAVCGNGIREPGETCDPIGSCPAACPESCPPRKLINPGTCRATCAEDPGTACRNGDGCCPIGCTAAQDSECGEPARMFVTSRTYAGDLGGLAGADAKCAASASAAGLSGRYVAYLATAEAAADSRLEGSSGWARVDGKPFANLPADVSAGRLFNLPRVDEHGQPADGPVFVGSRRTVISEADTCLDWTSAAADQSAIYGKNDDGIEGWRGPNAESCASLLRLYCFEVGRQARAGVHPVVPSRLAFVSHATDAGFTLTGADKICADDAAAAGRAGSFKALLAGSLASAASRFDLAGPPWVRSDGVAVVARAADIAVGKRLEAPLMLTTTGAVGPTSAWTGAYSPGEVAARNCNDWSDRSFNMIGLGGRTTTAGEAWFFNVQGAQECAVKRAIYCLEN